MAQNIIDLGFDIEKFDAQKKQIYEGIMEVYDIGVKLGATKIAPASGGGFSELRAQIEAAQTQIKQLQDANVKLTQSIADGATKTDGSTKKTKELSLEQARLSEATKRANADTRDQAKVLLEAERAAAAGGETVAQLKLKLDQLTKDRDRNITVLDPKALADANAKILQIKTTIDKIEQGGGNFRGNVGNYTGAINILRTSLEQATGELQKMNAAGATQGERYQQLSTEVSLLNELVGQQSQGFSSLTREVMATGKALETMNSLGLSNTQAFKKLETEYTSASVHLKEFRQEQKLLTQEMPKLAALTTVAKGLGGIYATGAGAAALFAGENTKIEKELNKLVAVMTILQGLHELNELLLKKNAIATVLFGGATTGATVALEGEAVAATTAAEATGFFSKALAFIEANPIILALTALAGVIIYLVTAFKSEEDQLKENAKASKEYTDAKNKELDILGEENKLLNQNIENQKKRAQFLLDEKTAGGTDATTVLAYKKAINDLDRQGLEEQIKQHPKITEEINEQTAAVSKLIEHQKTQQSLVTEFAKKLKNGETEVKTTFAKDDKTVVPELRGLTITQNTKDLLDASKESAKINDDAVTSAQGTLDRLTKIKEAGEEQQHKDDQIAAEAAKLNADEQRKLALATAQIQVELIKNKNQLILANEHSGFAERIAAMRSNMDAEKQLALAEESNVLTDPTKSKNDKIIAEKEYWAKVKEITDNGHAEIEKYTEDYNRRQLTAEAATKRSNIELEIKANDEISKNIALGVDVRMAAYGKGFQEQKQIILDDYNFQIATKVLTDKELIELDTTTKNKLKELAEKSKKEMADIFVSSRQEELKIEQSYDDLILAEKIKANSKISNKPKRDEANAEDTYEITKVKINNAINADKEILASALSTDQQKLDAQLDLNSRLAELYKLDTDHFLTAEEKKKAIIKEKNDLEKAIADETVNFVAAVIDGGYTKEANAIQVLIDKNNEYGRLETDRINNSTLSEQDKAAKLIQLSAEVSAKNTQLARQQKEEEIKKARFDKAVSIARIIEATAVAVVKSLPEGLLTGVTYLIGALGAVQLATAIATPVPTYGDGTDWHTGGDAIVGERGTPEAVKEPGKKTYIISKPTLLKSLPVGSQVIPLTAKEINDAAYGSMIENMEERFLVASLPKRDNAWEIARWQVDQLKEKPKQPIKIINKMDIGMAAYLEKRIFRK